MSNPRLDPSPTSVHLVVIIHGLWGSPDHVTYLANTLRKFTHSSTRNSNDQLDILIPHSIQWTNTYDGIDYCAEHVAREIDQRKQELESNHRRLSKFSCIGYSLGGLIGRFLIGLLHSRQPSFFEQIEPMNFNTFASPWIGMPRYKTVTSSTINFFGSRLLSRTGNQLYLIDKFHQLPDSKNHQTDQHPGHHQVLDNVKIRKNKIKFPLLSILAHPQTSFYKALLNFKAVRIYANSINDRTVPFVTGAIEKIDLFQIAKQISHKSYLVKYNLDNVSELDALQIAGLQLTFNPSYPALIDRVEFSQSSQLSSNLSAKEDMMARMARTERWKRSLPNLPFFLKPSTYPFRRPFNYLLAGLSPLIAPIFLSYIIGSFCYQSYQSRQRIKKYKVGDLENDSSRLKRVGLLQDLEQDLIEDIAGIGNQTALENDSNLSPSRPEVLSHENHILSPTDTQSSHQPETHELIQNQNHNKNEGSLPNDPYSMGSIADDLDQQYHQKKNHRSQGTQYPTSSSFEDFKLTKHDTGLSKIQVEMLENLNRLPNLAKFFGFLDGIPNSHGAIIYRAEGLSDKRGKKIVLHWAERFIL